MGNGGQSLEDQISDRINRSSLGIKVRNPVNGPEQGVYIDNPYDAINADKATRFGKHPKGDLPDRGYGPDILLPDLSRSKAIGLGLVREPTPSLEERTKIYLDWGADRAVKQPFIGVCETFNCVVLAILLAKNSPLPNGTVVEYIGVTQGALGHAIAVINRSNATEQIRQTVPNPPQWGDNCIVVDQWYALQAGTGPVFHVAGNQADQRYVQFLTNGTTRIDVRGRFTKDETRPPIQPRR